MATNNRLWVIGASIIIAAVLAMAWFVGASPMLATASANDVQRASVESQNLAQEARLARIKEEFANIESFRGDLADLQAAIPPSGDLSTFLGELHDLESATGVSVTSIGVGAATPFVAVAPEAAADGTNAETPPAEAPTTAEAPSPEEFIFIDVSLTVTGAQPQLLDFIDALQGGTRLYLVKSLTMSSDDGAFTASIEGSVYTLLDPSKPIFPDDEAVVEGEQVATEETTTP